MHPEEIKASLRIHGFTQAMLADELQVAQSSVHQAICGSIRSQRIQSRISEILGKSVKDIWPYQVIIRRSQAQIQAQKAKAKG
ncbi:helix-turn-helix domain-containing protein [Oceanospirillum beijerinckii]|uniref:helix-turn-helix domain-containing protein n=1 Tax=Oceanospirillum beijerinckii TaxID=64976 RepID=UPI0003F862C1|nr:helix-turn-helix domain-containing protein [Oceanospirillum beijerinckii]